MIVPNQLSDRKFLEMIVRERLEVLYKQQTTSTETLILNEGDKIIQELEKDKKEKMEAYLHLMEEQEDDMVYKAYTDGFKDCAKLMRILFKSEE